VQIVYKTFLKQGGQGVGYYWDAVQARQKARKMSQLGGAVKNGKNSLSSGKSNVGQKKKSIPSY
jgi:hypothetical protein